MSSFEHSLDHKAGVYHDMEWQENELPQVFTVTNSTDLIADKRLILLIWLTNEQSDQEVIGQVNIKMSEAIVSGTFPGQTRLVCRLEHKKITMANSLMGHIDGEFTFEVKDSSQTRRTSQGDPNAMDSI